LNALRSGRATVLLTASSERQIRSLADDERVSRYLDPNK
jgi:hypothetical protein